MLTLAHAVFHYLDWIAASFTLSGILLLANRKRAGWVVATCGSVLWICVAVFGVWAGRPIYGQLVLSVATICSNTYGWLRWGKAIMHKVPTGGLGLTAEAAADDLYHVAK